MIKSFIWFRRALGNDFFKIYFASFALSKVSNMAVKVLFYKIKRAKDSYHCCLYDFVIKEILLLTYSFLLVFLHFATCFSIVSSCVVIETFADALIRRHQSIDYFLLAGLERNGRRLVKETVTIAPDLITLTQVTCRNKRLTFPVAHVKVFYHYF